MAVNFSGENPAYIGRYSYAVNNPVSFTDPDGRFALSLGGEIEGSVFGQGGGVSAKLAMSLSRKPEGGFKFQFGFVSGMQTGIAGYAIRDTEELGFLETVAAFVLAAVDTGANVTAEAGAFVGTDENPADVEDLGGMSAEIGGTISKKMLTRAIGDQAMRKLADALPGLHIKGEFKIGENGIKGVEIGGGGSVGLTYDMEQNEEATVISEVEF